MLLDNLDSVLYAQLGKLPALSYLVSVGVAVRTVLLGGFPPPVAVLGRSFAITLVELAATTSAFTVALPATTIGKLEALTSTSVVSSNSSASKAAA